MWQFPKRVGLSFLGGTLIQLAFFLVAVVVSPSPLGLILLLPGWVIAYAGRSSDPAWGLPVMMLTNAVTYAPLVYLLLYWRPFEREEVISILAE